MSESDQFQTHLRRLTAPFVSLSQAQVDACWNHFLLMRRWNRVINLTRISGVVEAVERHYAESFFLAAQLPEDVATVVDLGSGAGFPGFVVAVARPEWKVILVESDQRKAAFLRECRDLASNVQIECVRGELFAGQADIVVSRAVKSADVVAVAGRVAGRLAVLMAEADAEAVGLPQKRLVPVPFRPGSVVCLADVPRET